MTSNIQDKISKSSSTNKFRGRISNPLSMQHQTELGLYYSNDNDLQINSILFFILKSPAGKLEASGVMEGDYWWP